MTPIIIKSSNIAISPQKMSPIAGLIRKKKMGDSLNILTFLPKKGGRILYKLLKGTVKNLVKNQESLNDYHFSKIEVNRGKIQKKIIYRAKGRSDRIRKRHCLVNLYLTKSKKE